METMIQRISVYIAGAGMTENEFARKCGFSPSILSRARQNGTNLNKGTVEKILKAFPDIDIKWLEGEKLIDRLEKFMAFKGLNNNRITSECGLCNGIVGHARIHRSNLRKENVEKILARYPELDRDWLLYGKGTSPYDDIIVSKYKSLKMDKDPKAYEGDNVLKLFRKANDIKQFELAEYLKYNVTSLCQMENYLHGIPNWVIRCLKDNDRGWDVSMLPDISDSERPECSKHDGMVSMQRDVDRSLYLKLDKDERQFYLMYRSLLNITPENPNYDIILDILLRNDIMFRIKTFTREELDFSLFLDLLEIQLPAREMYTFSKLFVKDWDKGKTISEIWNDVEHSREDFRKDALLYLNQRWHD